MTAETTPGGNAQATDVETGSAQQAMLKIDGLVADMNSKMNSIRSTVETGAGSGGTGGAFFQGHSAGRYGAQSQDQQDRFQPIRTRITNLAAEAKLHINKSDAIDA